MKKKKICLEYKRKKINIEVENCNFLGKGRGLTFRRREKAPALLFDLRKKIKAPLTSYFVFFDFLVLWCDKNYKILEVRKIKPWNFVFDSKFSYEKIIEIPISKRYFHVVKLLVDS